MTLLKDSITKQAFQVYATQSDMWDEFLKERYEGGKKKVPNTNPKTKDKYKEVSMSTLYNSTKSFKNKINKEFRAWSKAQEFSDAGNGKSLPIEQAKKKLPSLLKNSDKKVQSFFSELDTNDKETYDYFIESFKYQKTEEAKTKFLRNKAASLSKIFNKLISQDKEGFEDMVGFWLHNSGNNHISWQIHSFAFAMGFKGSDYVLPQYKSLSEEQKWGHVLEEKTVKPLSLAYSFQQKIFKDLGVKELTLYRGVQVPSDQADTKELKLETRAASSMTNSKDVADTFGSVTIQYKVPVKNILMSPFVSKELSVFGYKHQEDEYVVCGAIDMAGTNTLDRKPTTTPQQSGRGMPVSKPKSNKPSFFENETIPTIPQGWKSK